MRRDELEHLLRASAEVADDRDIVVVGSQAILAQRPDAPESLRASMEADVFPAGDPSRAYVIDGAIGELSPFHETFGYFAHGVGPETVTAPAGWRDRLVRLRNENTRGATGWCIEAHDLVLAKCAAGREKDWAFAREAIRHGMVDLDRLLSLLVDLGVSDRRRDEIRRRLETLGRDRD